MKKYAYVVVSTHYDPDAIGQDPYVQIVCEDYSTAARWISDVLKKCHKNHSNIVYYTILKTEYVTDHIVQLKVNNDKV